MDHHDVIVLGLGGVGSLAARALALRGASVLGIEQYALVHARGSSHGGTRIIRKAYFEHPDYVPLLMRAYAAWDELSRESGERLFERNGLLLVGPPEAEVVAGTRAAADQHGLPLEVHDAGQLDRLFPGFQPYEGALALFEEDAGFLRVEDCVRAALTSAQAHGARLLESERVLSWEASPGSVVVRTAEGEHGADALVVAAGAWAGGLLPPLAHALHPQRKMQLWLSCDEPALSLERGCPTFGVQEPDGAFFYGFPSIDPGSIKLAEHGPGEPVPDPSQLRRTRDESDHLRVADFAARRLRGVAPPVLRHAACMYTMSPDGHFVVDRHPEHGHVSYAAGLSGHGFKLASVLGEVLADLALTGRTALPVGFLSASRLQESAS